MSVFKGNNTSYGLMVKSGTPVAIAIQNWTREQIQWTQSIKTALPNHKNSNLSYHFKQLLPHTKYQLYKDDKPVQTFSSDQKGHLTIEAKPGRKPIRFQLSRVSS